MYNFIVKQISFKHAHRLDSDERNGLYIYDFCISKRWGTSDEWLLNKRGNGWSYKERDGAYTNFKLELIK